jgi:hypothetical protein
VTARWRRGAAEIVGVGGDIAKTAHAGRLGLVRRLRGRIGTARRDGTVPGRRQRRILHAHRRLRRPLRRWRRIEIGRRSRRLGPKIALLRRRRRARRPGAGGRRRIAGLGGVGARGAGAERIAGAGSCARGFAGALGDLGFDLAHRLFQRQPVVGDVGLAERRIKPAQLRDQRRARPLIDFTPLTAGCIGVQGGNGAGNQRVVISHISLSGRFPEISR